MKPYRSLEELLELVAPSQRDGCLCHLCDVTSARIWFDYPAAAADPWPSARPRRSA